MEADIAERAAQRCDDVDLIINDLRPLGRERGFGDNDHGHQVVRAFKDTAVGGENSVVGVLREAKGRAAGHGTDLPPRRPGGAAAEPANQQMSSSGAS